MCCNTRLYSVQLNQLPTFINFYLSNYISTPSFPAIFSRPWDSNPILLSSSERGSSELYHRLQPKTNGLCYIAPKTRCLWYLSEDRAALITQKERWGFEYNYKIFKFEMCKLLSPPECVTYSNSKGIICLCIIVL